MSEHTAEYVLVPKFSTILEQSFTVVIPIFFWSTREGGLAAKTCFRDCQFKIVAMYARRPKVFHIGQEYIDVKFNDTLFIRASHLQNNGIPVFAGVPFVSSLENVRLNLPCIWFKIDPLGNECTIQLDQNTIFTECNSVQKVLPADILHLISYEARSMTWSRILEVVKQKRHLTYDRYSGYGLWGQNYKPVYFILPIDDLNI